MRGVNDKNFFNSWQILYRATCPNAAQSHWQVDDVDWHKERHSFFADSYAMSIDVHLLRRRRPNATGSWKLMIVIENWWSGDNELLRTATWARVVEGNPKAVLNWMRVQERIPGRASFELPVAPAVENKPPEA